FRQELQKLGWTDGSNVRIDSRWGDANPTRIRAQAKELVRLNPDVLLVSTGLVLQPLLEESRSIPIVFAHIAPTLAQLLEVLKAVAPHVTRVAVILNPDQRPQAGMLRAIEANASAFKVQVTAAGARNAAELENAIDQSAREPDAGLIVLPNPVTLV